MDRSFVGRRRTLIASIAIIGLFAGAGAGVFALGSATNVPSALVGVCQAGGLCTSFDLPEEPPTGADIPDTIVSQDLIDQAFAAKEDRSVTPGTRMILLPHHLVAAREIASLVSATPEPSVVYLISPDHFAQGHTVFTTTDRGFSLPDGRRVPNVPSQVATLLNDVPKLSNDAKPFATEHGVLGLLPFMHRVWPNAKVVPVIIRTDASDEDRASLAGALAERLVADPHALLVSSLDFSHYLPAGVADLHDLLSEDVVSSLSDLEADRAEVGFPSVLGVTLKIARLLDLGDVTIQAHTNSLRLLNAQVTYEGTSHVLASFAPGPIQKEQTFTALFTGDLMFDRTVRDRAKGDYAALFDAIKGQEGRFFEGQDIVVGNLEGPVTTVRHAPVKSIDFAFDPAVATALKQMGFTAVSQANNHSLDQGRVQASVSLATLRTAGVTPFGDEVQDDATHALAILTSRGQKAAVLGFNVTDNALDKTAALAALKDARAQAGHVIVFMHWGVEYTTTPTMSQIGLAHWFIDNGADAVIGAHPHWMQSVEVYHGHPIAYSLGNFIFDQDWSKETQYGLVVGLAFEPAQTQVFLYPIAIDKSHPRLVNGTARTARLQRLASISDPSLKEQILSGVLSIPK